MIFQGTAIPNLIIEIAGIMICLFALLTIWYGSRRYTATKLFLASFFWKKLQAFLENVASPFWRKLQPHGVAGATPWKQTFFVKSY